MHTNALNKPYELSFSWQVRIFFSVYLQVTLTVGFSSYTTDLIILILNYSKSPVNLDKSRVGLTMLIITDKNISLCLKCKWVRDFMS